jgi:hypothetical protein
MNDPVRIERLHRVTPAQKGKLEAFAASFGHRFPEIFPVDLAYVNGELKGYYQVTEHAVVYPALHPERTSPRDFYRLFHHLLAAYRQRYGNFWVVTELEYPKGGPTQEVLVRMGMKPVKRTFYQIPD